MKSKKDSAWEWVQEILKENSFLVTILPILTTALMYLIANFLQTLELQTWNIPIEAVENTNSGKYFYLVATGLLFYSSTALIPLFWYPKTEKDIVSIKLQRFLRKTLKQVRKTLKKQHACPREISKKIEAVDKSLKNQQKESAKRVWSLIRYGLLCFIVSCGIFYVNLGFTIEFTISYSIIMAILLIVALYLFSNGRGNNPIERLSLEAKNSRNCPSSLLDVCEKTLKVLQQVIDEKPIKLGKTEIIEYVVTSLGVSIMIFFLSTTFIQWSTVSLRHEFWTYNEHDKEYVIVYEFDNKIVLKEAQANEDHLQIYLDRQVILDKNGLELKYKKFKSVEKIED